MMKHKIDEYSEWFIEEVGDSLDFGSLSRDFKWSTYCFRLFRIGTLQRSPYVVY